MGVFSHRDGIVARRRVASGFSMVGKARGEEALKVGVVGATGVVGQEMLRLLESSPLGEYPPHLLASPRSAGRIVPWRDQELTVHPLDENADLAALDVSLMAAGSEIARQWAPRFVDAGGAVVDNSSAFRLDDDVPLVIPAVNPEMISPGPGIIANPNCSRAVMSSA